ncbi:uncharacterized protein K452DRAFT_300300 [Aplosporella prunicola CBS 121167]|uniref:Uncharacterized protein n=1 Tax=Aplosporella prunicola CBS 121167 TaxID=1176127 RepID=A0A6A6B746_9PEZI|nr:uncharacterized protein K452DRAFT_300300 [Aplosporella prunicola CBS 121167]KAF2139223.1 hypothetical protein K452DRAFT_300300 [Aplosporella prunicola CBS 121167]
MAFVPQNNVVKRVADDIVSVTESEVHPQMWPELNSYSYAKKYGQDGARQQSFRIYSSDEMPMTYFVSAMPNGTTTGVFRQHSLRFNSSVLCNQAIRSDFPSKCPGVRPFEAALNIPDFLNVSVCVPGEFGVLPWTLTRSRQDITEEMYFDVMVSPSLGFNESDRKNFTLHCQANTTRGFFELGNYRNGYAPGPLLDKWPSMDELTRDFNDMLRFKNNRPPGETEYVPDYPSFGQDHVFWAHGKSLDPYGTDSLNVSGPLMTSAIAIFGNESFFHIAASSNGSSAAAARDEICRQGNIPFARYSYNMFGKMPDYCNKTLDEDSTSSRTLARLMNGWLWYWNDTKNARELLKASIFLASHETLAQTVDETYSQGSRTIYTAPGATIIKPDVSTTGIVIISTLIALQVLGLSYVVWYIGRVPIWTSALDAFAVARIGSNIGLQNLAPIGRADHDLQKLSRMDGLVGTVTDSRNGDGIVGLGLGAPGVVTRDLAKRE